MTNAGVHLSGLELADTSRQSTSRRCSGAGGRKSKSLTVQGSYAQVSSAWKYRLCAVVSINLLIHKWEERRYLQVAVLPISQIPSLHACILAAGHLLPLETIFSVPAPPTSPSDVYADKRTWRTPKAEDTAREQKRERWTAGGIMEARALDRGYRES